MKSKFEKTEGEPNDENDQTSSAEQNADQYDPDAGEVVEVDNSGPDVANAKGSKMLVLVASAILITVVLYFFFFRGDKTNKVEKIEEVTTQAVTPSEGVAPAKPEVVDDFPAEDYILEKPKEPELPKLPELPKDNAGQGFSGILPAFIDVPKEEKNASVTPPPLIPQTPTQPPSIPQIDQNIPAQIPPVQNPPAQTPPVASAPADNAKEMPNPRKSPIIISGGGGSGGGKSEGGSTLPIAGVGYENNIVKLNSDPLDQLKKTEVAITPTVVANMSNTIIQGKILTAVLETAISTELPGFVRAVVSRDVYAESGNNILIPKGSRLYGAYSSQIVRGQARVQIGWTRLIRPDGVDMNISFNASDQFGRAGIDGDVDNKYGSIIGNSILTSVLAVSGAIVAEKLAGGSATNTTTTDALGNVTSTGQASNKLIYDASKAVIDTVGQIIGNAVDTRPVIRVPQGTRITILANADITLPSMRKTSKPSNGPGN